MDFLIPIAFARRQCAMGGVFLNCGVISLRKRSFKIYEVAKGLLPAYNVKADGAGKKA